jgi:N-acetylmuramoyl-L-alanine amidase
MAELITVKYLTKHINSRPGYKLTSVKNIVVHYVANPGTTADQNWRNFENNKPGTSAHFIIDLDGSIIQCMPLDEVAWAIGTTEGNYSTISIECCHPDSTGKFTDATYESLIKLVSWLCNEYGLTADQVKRHYDYPRKNNSGVVWHKECPIYFVKHPEEWEKFIDSLLIQ